jgi:hypothetical protein
VPRPDIKDIAKKAKGGDKEALGDLVLSAPEGLRGKEPDAYASEMADNEDAFKEDFEGEAEGPLWARKTEGKAAEDEGAMVHEGRQGAIIDILGQYGLSTDEATKAANEIMALGED